MFDRRGLRLATLLTTGVLGVCAAGASAGQPFQDTVHDERTFVLHDYCDVEGLDVELHSVLDMRVQVDTRGPDGFSYFLQHGTTTETLTNLADGTQLRSLARVVEKDLHITDNGDGTFTIIVIATGNATLYGPDGKAIARNPGQVRLELLVDDAGTPDDPFDDELVSRRVVKPSTGRSDDFCEAAVPALT